MRFVFHLFVFVELVYLQYFSARSHSAPVCTVKLAGSRGAHEALSATSFPRSGNTYEAVQKQKKSLQRKLASIVS